MLFLHLSKGRFTNAARVTGVTVVGLFSGLFTGKTQLLGINDDDVVARIDMRRVFRLVLATQAQGNLAGQTAENLVGGIDHIPVALDFKRLGRESLHL